LLSQQVGELFLLSMVKYSLWSVYVIDVCDAVWLLEPGYYEVGSFGIRLETLITVVKASTKVMSYLIPFGLRE